MARLGRYFLPDQPLHVIQRGNNREAIFFGEEDYARYCDWLAAAAAEYGCAIHGYVLMTNHVHLLVTPPSAHHAVARPPPCAPHQYGLSPDRNVVGRALSRRAGRWRSVRPRLLPHHRA